MVGRDDDQVVLAQPGFDFRQAAIESLQSIGVAPGVATMPVDHVELDQIDEEQSVEVFHEELQHGVAAGLIVRRVVGACDASAGKNILDLSDGQDVPVGVFQLVQQDGGHGFERVVPTVAGAGETVGIVAKERPGDDAADGMLAVEDFAGAAAGGVEFLDGHDILMGRHLKHAVGRGVDDQVAGFEMLRAEFLDHLRAGGGPVGQDAAAGPTLEFVDDVRRKSMGVGGEWRPDDAPH